MSTRPSSSSIETSNQALSKFTTWKSRSREAALLKLKLYKVMGMDMGMVDTDTAMVPQKSRKGSL